MAPEGSVRAGVRCNHTERPVGSRLSVLAGTHNGWYASAFTQGSLPWNLETLLGCQCANELVQVYYRLLPMSSK
jgi:hypothetical protein